MALIIPEVFSSLTREKFVGNIKVANLAIALGDLKNTTQGETITFPRWRTLSGVTEVVRGVESANEALDQDSSTATIKMYDKIVPIYDYDDFTILGNSINEAASQMGILFARQLDTNLIEDAKTTALKSPVAGATAITEAEVLTALGLFGDNVNVDSYAGIVINSLLLPSLYGMSAFTDVNKTFNGLNGNGVIVNGLVGYLYGIPVYVANHGTYDTTLSECISFVIKKNALGYMEKKAISIAEERKESLHMSKIVGTYTFATKLLADDGVVMIRKTIA